MNSFNSATNKAIDQTAADAKNLANRAHDALDTGVEKVRDSAKDIVSATKSGLETGADNVERAAKSFMSTLQEWLDQGKKSCTDMAGQAKDRSIRATEACESYIKQEPMKAVAIAAAAGLLIGSVFMVTRRRD